ncbi:MAG: adenylosuccinate synthetase, partial [Candidatus Riesia sp.]|nr:adenylosuccinate synthetase [Candidatus Riesia sp.]
MRGEVTAVVGAQYGSEGKGAVVQSLAKAHHVHVRTGGPNRRYTDYHGGKVYEKRC